MGRKKHPEPLTPAEQRVLEEVRTGATNAEIAVRLGLSINTVKYHVANMLAKTGLTDRSELREWNMPREGGPNWWLRGAVAVGGLVGVVGLMFLGRGEDAEREAWIAYLSGDPGPSDTIGLVEIHSGERRELLAGDGWEFALLDWSPDGRWLAAGAVKPGSDEIELRIYERETLELGGTVAGAIESFWAPDSTRLAVVGLNFVTIVDERGNPISTTSINTDSRRGSPQWSPNGEWFVLAGETSVRTWDRGGFEDEVVAADLPWPVQPTMVALLGYQEPASLLLIGGPRASSGLTDPMIGIYDLNSGTLTILESIPQSGDPLYEYETVTASRPDLVLQTPDFSVEGKSRYYRTYPSNQEGVSGIRLLVVTGTGTLEAEVPDFNGVGRRAISLVLVGDWPEPPPLPVATPTTDSP